MSIPGILYTCTICGFRYVFQRPMRFYKYLFNDNTVLKMKWDTGWCFDCDCVACVEVLPSLDELYERAKIICSSEGDEAAAFINESVSEIYKRIQWRKERVSPARCMDCGRVKISTLDFIPISDSVSQTKEFTHKCGGFLQVKDDVDGLRICFKSTDEIPVLYDYEGNLIV